MVFQKRELAFSQTATVEFCYLLFIAANYYFNVYLNIPIFLHKKKNAEFILIFIAGIVVSALLRVPLALFLNKNLFIHGQPQPTPLRIFTNALLNIGIWVVCIVAAKLMIDRFRFQQYVDEMKKQKEEAELNFLNAQFNPHFLFNSINSIYGHIDKQNTVARNMLLTFSDMLRYQLYDCNENQILVDKELNYIKNYIALQRARKNAQLKTVVEIPENVKGFMISPLLFMAFIENSFKYSGSGDDPGDYVSISFKKEDNYLFFICQNSKRTNFVNNTEHKGIGMSNARRRLELLYPSRHELKINEDNNLFEVNLKIKIE